MNIHCISVYSEKDFLGHSEFSFEIVSVHRNHHKDNKDPSNVDAKKKEGAFWSSSKQQLTDGSRDNMEEGSHYMTIPTDTEYLALQQDPVDDSHVYSSPMAPSGRGEPACL